MDPLTKSYPMLTPYQFASNTPIEAIDLDGLEAMKPVYGDDGSITSVIATSDATITQTRHIPLEVKKEAPKPQLTQVFVPQTIIGPDNSNLSFSERQAKVRQYEAQVQYQNFIETGQQLDPFTFGGSGNNPYGFARTFGTALEEAPAVVLPEMAIAKFSSLYKQYKTYSHYKNLVKTLDFSTDANQAVFYSGPGNRAKAIEFAIENGKKTIDLTSGGKLLNEANLYEVLPREMADDIWKMASEQFANKASGQVTGFVKGARPDRVFESVEYPILQSNTKVTNVITGGN